MNIEAVCPRSGVFFARTKSGGGILMDVPTGRYIALTPVSALIWSGLVIQHGKGAVVDRIAQEKGLSLARAEELFLRQIDIWRKAGLIDDGNSESIPLPHLQPAPGSPPGSLDQERLTATSPTASECADLSFLEFSYSRALRRDGLAKTLVRLQRQGTTVTSPEALGAVYESVRAHLFLRRMSLPTPRAHERLVRSMALSASLRKQGIRSDVCIGIIEAPFESHAWVEAGGLILNETLELRLKSAVLGRF
ncbi:MAG: lasso peptide biosynthesis B2 protein [Cyanobacteria bacterium]|nr:lasso peptide biosynthesis B2 protein [Cyanobacteriota bacterium]